MKISELIAELQKMKDVHGDVPVLLSQEWGMDPVEEVEFTDNSKFKQRHGVPSKYVEVY